MNFTLMISNSAYPLIPPATVTVDPQDQTPMSLPRARQIAAMCLDEYIKANTLSGRNVAKARFTVNSLEPNHFVDLETLHIEIRSASLIIQ
jgi:hypothetical protein